MTKDQLKKKLRRYLDIKAERAQIAEQYNALADPRGANLDGMPKGPGSGDPLAGITEKRRGLLKRYAAKLAELDAAQAEIEDMIESLEPKERTIFRHRYLEGLGWEEVCVAVNYSWRRTHDIHSQALDKLLEKYGEEATP